MTGQEKVLNLPLSKQWIYALGQLGWSILINIVNLQLIYFYIPPADSGIPFFITQVVFLGVLNIIMILAATGRIFDAVTDPLIAHWSDKSTNPKGRRLPIMLKAVMPAAFFCALMFFPISGEESFLNVLWLFLTQILFYFFLTLYVTPYFALLPEFGHTPKQRLNLSTWISITYALGIMVASQVPGLAAILEDSFELNSIVKATQWSIAIICAIAMIFMSLPSLFIQERKYSKFSSNQIGIVEAIRHTFRNKHFRYYVVADFCYFMGITIIMTGLLYFITVLLQLEKEFMGVLLPIMVVVSFLFYPFVNLLARRFGKKVLVSMSFILMSIIFLLSFYLGRWPMSMETQAYTLVIFYAIPIAFLGILPNAVLSDIAAHDSEETGIDQAGMFFAARTLMQKFGQTFGVFIFALLTIFGKDIGNDLGIRMSAIVGAILCLIAGVYFMKYNEKEVLSKTI